ncbi:MAG: hypothetical protein HYZ44_00460 [Bacteroidetes bacterium]|nr:hypothetical protein [Bacteroidota bacterium]
MCRSGVILCFLVLVSSCATYYQANYQFNRNFESGDLQGALATLKTHSRDTGRDRFLNFVNKGLVLSMLGQYEESNNYFEQAFLFWEDFKVDYFSEGASYLVNPTITVYRGEDHEHLMLLYYKALNYLKMQKTEEALVECRRLNIRLQQLSDRYSSDNYYKRDAFVQNLMGIIYDADKDYNNAFIAYKNSLESYQNEYQKMFQFSAPRQLKLDILRTAWLSGMQSEYDKYKEEFAMPDYQYTPQEGGELIFFWHSGLAPYKAEWGINFVIDHGSDYFIFRNSELNLTFQFPKSGYSKDEADALTRLEFFHVAFPRYVERSLYFDEGNVVVNNQTYPLELTEDVNKIAFKVLEERMGFELSKALIRLAIKKASEYTAKKEDKRWGAILGIVNTLTEKADTRNWQTLPHSIYYARVPLPEGQSTVTLSLGGVRRERDERTFTYEVKKGQVLYHTFSSLETTFGNNRN